VAAAKGKVTTAIAIVWTRKCLGRTALVVQPWATLWMAEMEMATSSGLRLGLGPGINIVTWTRERWVVPVF
jgi:hypothetical protein